MRFLPKSTISETFELVPSSVSCIRLLAHFPPQQILLGFQPHFFEVNQSEEEKRGEEGAAKGGGEGGEEQG